MASRSIVASNGESASIVKTEVKDGASGHVIIDAEQFGNATSNALVNNANFDIVFDESYIFVYTSDNQTLYIRKFDYDGVLLSDYNLTHPSDLFTGYYVYNSQDGFLSVTNNPATYNLLYRINVVTDEAEIFYIRNTVEELFTFIYHGLGFAIPDQSIGFDLKISAHVDSKEVVKPVSEILTDLCKQAGLQSTEYDVTGINSTITGYIISALGSVRNALEPLVLYGLFDAVEKNGKITFIERGSNPILTLTEDDLIAGSDGEIVSHTRIQEYELPKTVEITFADIGADHQKGVQKAEKIVTDSNLKMAIDLPISMTATQALQLAEVLLRAYWIERDTFEFKLTYRQIDIDVSDVITLQYDGLTYTVRITEIEKDPSGIIACKAVREAGVYSSNSIALTTPVMTSTITAKSGTRLYLFDLPLLSNDNAEAGIYAAVKAINPTSWTGATLLQSLDGGVTYNAIKTMDKTAIIGNVATPLADGRTEVWDTINTLTVETVGPGTLSTANIQSVLNNSNLAIIGSEIISFANAVDNSDGTFTLSHLLRGKRGTEWATGSHVANETFAMISGNSGYDVAVKSYTLGLYKAVSFGKKAYEVSPQTFTNNGIREKPFSPVHIKLTRDASNNATITWLNRSRHTAFTLQQAKLYEATERYELDILVAGSVVRTLLTTTNKMIIYDAASQTADGITPGDPIEFNLYQLSATVGRGYPANRVL